MKRTSLILVALVAISAALADEQPHALSAINPARLLTQIEAGITLAITYQNGTTATRYTSGQQLVLTLSGVTPGSIGAATATTYQYIAAYAPSNTDYTAYPPVELYVLNRNTGLNTTGTTSFNITGVNYRQDVVYRYITGVESPGTPLTVNAVSNIITPIPNEPTQVRLALTGNPGEMRVTWTQRFIQTPLVRYGPRPNAGAPLPFSYPLNATATSSTYNQGDLCGNPDQTTGWFDPGQFLSVVLTNLTSASKYYYTVGDDGYGLYSAEFSFTTPPRTGQPGPVTFILSADMGYQFSDGNPPTTAPPAFVQGFTNTGNPGANAVSTAMAAEVRNGASLVLLNGDICYADGFLSTWDVYGLQVQPIAANAPFMVLEGNHERDFPGTNDAFSNPAYGPGTLTCPAITSLSTPYCITDSRGECGVVTTQRFKMPGNGQAQFPSPTPAKAVPTYYSFNYGPVHFLNYNTEIPYDVGTPQWLFIQNDLAGVDRSQTPFIVVGGHRPIYPATNDFTGFNVTQPPPFPTLALPPFYFTAYPNQTSSDPASPNYYAAYTGTSVNRVVQNYPATDGDQYVALRQRNALEGLFNKYGVDVAYYGHKHTYQRTQPLVNGVVTPNSADGSNPGTIYYTAGNAGRALQSANAQLPSIPYFSAKVADNSCNTGGPSPTNPTQPCNYFGYVRVVADLNTMTLTAIDANGGVPKPQSPGDVVVVTRKPLPSPPAPAPSPPTSTPSPTSTPAPSTTPAPSATPAPPTAAPTTTPTPNPKEQVADVINQHIAGIFGHPGTG